MIREASSSDYKSVSEILRGERMLEPISRKRFLDSLNPNLHKSERWFVAENTKKVVGTSYCFWGSIYGYIGKVAVEKEYRGKKIGSELMKKTIGFLKNQDVASIHLVVREGEEENLVFFEKKGFKYHFLYLMDAKV